MQRKTNWLAIVVAALVSFFIGFLWYGLLFQNAWMEGNYITMEGEKMFKNGVEMPMSFAPMIVNTIAMIFYAIVMDWVLGRMGIQTWMEGAKVGAVLGLLMVVGILTGNMFAAIP
ncbi:MAG: DUF1761 domain-containing protein [Lewinellaceae bacterium]|nr:DUF1761 domain-containing protein [Lewinellaceae bacterium]